MRRREKIVYIKFQKKSNSIYRIEIKLKREKFEEKFNYSVLVRQSWNIY